MRRRFTNHGIAAGLALALLATGCSSDDGASSSSEPPPSADDTTEITSPPATDPPPAEPQPADADTLAAVRAALDAAPAATCDPLDTTRCYLPFPSNAATAADPSSRTGRRVAFDAAGLPANAEGVPVDPAEWNRNDGFSPNSTLLVHLADLDPVGSALPSWTDLAASLADDSSVVLVDVSTGDRLPLWAELDANAASDDDRLLVVHPAISLPEGHTFAIGLRNLMTTSGNPVEATAAFRVYRDRLLTDIDAVESRRPDMEAALTALEAAGVPRQDLQLAWDFTVASTESLSERMLHIRDDALATLNGGAPEVQVTGVEVDPRDGVALTITGEITVPSYLTDDGGPGSRFSYTADTTANPDLLPARNGIVHPTFQCNVPRAVMDGTGPARIAQYGHGLLGSEDEINAGNVRDFGNEHNIVFCATKWAGMSEEDVPNAVASLQDFSNFPTMADRLQQGVLNQIFLGRAMTHPDGLAALPEMRRADGSPLIDPTQFAYDGNSQGGIMGLMLAAVSPDFDRAVLGVMGMNYSMLLPRSVDFDTYEAIMVPAYPDDLDRMFLISFIQMLWDRGEGAGYVQHVTADPYPGTPAKQVLLHVGFGDWQVTELSAMVAARTMGVPIHRPVTGPDRSREVEPGYGLDSIEYGTSTSGLVIWDSGSDPIPVDNVPPSTSRDSHEDPRADPDVRDQKAAFMFDGALVDVCGGGPCTADQRD